MSVSHPVFTSVFVKTWRRDGKGPIRYIHLTIWQVANDHFEDMGKGPKVVATNPAMLNGEEKRDVREAQLLSTVHVPNAQVVQCIVRRGVLGKDELTHAIGQHLERTQLPATNKNEIIQIAHNEPGERTQDAADLPGNLSRRSASGAGKGSRSPSGPVTTWRVSISSARLSSCRR